MRACACALVPRAMGNASLAARNFVGRSSCACRALLGGRGRGYIRGLEWTVILRTYVRSSELDIVLLLRVRWCVVNSWLEGCESLASRVRLVSSGD